jgi:transposase, IS30 family
MQMGRRGRKRQLDVESRYWQLVLSGVGTVEACRMVGIGRKTGYRWRAENGGLPPARVASGDCERSNRYLCLLERQRIATLRAQGLGVREIARRLDRSPSTISRELRRNLLPHDRNVYDADLANARARERCRRGRERRLLTDAELRAVVQDKLEQEWSPEQIAAFLRRAYPDRPDWHICHETIYQALFTGTGGLSRQLTRRLRTGRPLRKRRRRADRREVRFSAPAKLIDTRPAEAGARERVGHWEGDLIVGRSSQSAIGTLVDRASRYVRLIHLPRGHSADELLEALDPLLEQMPGWTRLTLTWDQGSEMARHDQLADRFRDGIFFAHAASPWLRPTNENTNGLLRQYFPKGTNLAVYDLADLRAVEQKLNNRPRKTLGWATPAEIYNAALTG